MKVKKLSRFPFRKNDKFQAWNSADEYIIRYIDENKIYSKKLVIIEDEFGALACNLTFDKLHLVNDSINSLNGIIANLKSNNLFCSNIIFENELTKVHFVPDLIIIKNPKNKRYFEHILHQISVIFPANIPIIAGGMIKYMNKNFINLFFNYTNDPFTSLGWKKSRLILGKTKSNVLRINDKTILDVDDFPIKLVNFPNVFSYDKLDIGSRFFLENFPKIPDGNILDIGCGNGLLGIFAGKSNPNASLYFTDISFKAIKSAKESCKINKLNNTKYFYFSHSAKYIKPNSIDLILCNPPFHENHKVTLSTALEIFEDCKRVLKIGASVWIVANKHLGYHVHLKKIFGNVRQISSNNKFVILKSEKMGEI